MPLPSGTRVGRATLHVLIAQGGVAGVRRAEQDPGAGLRRPAAVKLRPPGHGPLRICVHARGRTEVVVHGGSRGEPPVSRQVPAGLFPVSARLADGETSPPYRVTVMPDRITITVHHPATRTWTTP